MRWSQAAACVFFGALGVAAGAAVVKRPEPTSPVATGHNGAMVVHDVVARDSVRADLYLPKPGARPAPWLMFVHERGWPAPDDKERDATAIADALQRRGIGVAVVSFDISDAHPLARTTQEVADLVHELSRRATESGLQTEPVLAGVDAAASLVTSLVLDAHWGVAPAQVRGVLAMNGTYDLESFGDAARANAPPFVVLASHADSPASAQSSRALTRALERAGAKSVHGYFASTRDEHSLTNLSGDRNEVADLVAAFARGEPTPGGAEGTWALMDTWGPKAPLTSEPFWSKSDEPLVVRRPTDARFRAEVRNVFGEMIRDLEPWPALTYDAIDLGDYLRAHPELGGGDWVIVTNARGEQVVLTRSEIDRKKPAIVIGIDDERNLFRMFVTYDVHRTYSWKDETEARPLLVRNVGAFLYVPNEGDGGSASGGALHVVTMASFALTTASFNVVSTDPLASTRGLAKPVAFALTNEQGCLQCHALHGSGARAHHVRAADGKLAEGFGLALEEYPHEVLHRFLFEQETVAKSFGVSPLRVDDATATALFAEATR